MFGDAAVASVASDAVAALEQQPRYDVICKVNAAQERAAACHFLSQQLPSGTSHVSTCVSVCTRQNLRSPIPENIEPPQPVNNKTTSTLSFVCVDGLEGSSPVEHCGRGGGEGGGGGRLGGLRPGRVRNRTSAVRVPVDQAHGCRQKAILGKSCSHSMCSGQIVSSAARNGARGVQRLPFSGRKLWPAEVRARFAAMVFTRHTGHSCVEDRNTYYSFANVPKLDRPIGNQSGSNYVFVHIFCQGVWQCQQRT